MRCSLKIVVIVILVFTPLLTFSQNDAMKND